eukprot:g15156.t1
MKREPWPRWSWESKRMIACVQEPVRPDLTAAAVGGAAVPGQQEAPSAVAGSPESLGAGPGKEEEVYICSVCGRGVTGASPFSLHQRVHASHCCATCGKGFTRSSNLARHRRMHALQPVHRCPRCGKCFRQASDLQRHRLVHTGERWYRCGECGKTFTQSSNLARHKRIHTGERPFTCAA